MEKRVGLVGIGLVGTALAERFLAGGGQVVGYDIDPARCRHLEGLGGTAASSATEVAEQCRSVVLSLLTTETVREVVCGERGLLRAAIPPRTIVDTTTGDVEQTITLAGELAQQGIVYLDATLSGSSAQVRLGEAVVMVGGADEAFAASIELLHTISPQVFHVGPVGSGCKAKLASNLVLGLNRAALAEGLVLAEQLGLALEPFLDLLMASPAQSAIMRTKGPKMVKGEFAPQARLSQHRKDVAIIQKYARLSGQDLPLTEAHARLLDEAIAAGDGDLDNAAVIRQIRRQRADRQGTE